MKIKLYDRVLLKDGCEAWIVEILQEGVAYIADVSKEGDTSTEEVWEKDIEKVLR